MWIYLIVVLVVVVERFLDILAARKDPSGLSGEVLIDRAPQPPNFKCLSGYVVQVCCVDCLKLHGNTVWSHLLPFSKLIRQTAAYLHVQ